MINCKRVLCALLTLPLLALAACAEAPQGTSIAILRIGKADAIIIKDGNAAILIDAGEDDDGAEILAYLRGQGIRRLDAMIITHFDKDHVGSADYVADGIPVDAVYDADYESDSKQYRQYTSALLAANVPRFRVASPLTLTFGALSLTLMPTARNMDGDNDQSLAVSMTDGRHTFFFAGDAEKARISELLEGGLSAHDFVKMPHHGRDKENLGALLDALSPRIAVITDSDSNPAEAATIEKLTTHGIESYFTRNGDILITSDQKGLHVTQ